MPLSFGKRSSYKQFQNNSITSHQKNTAQSPSPATTPLRRYNVMVDDKTDTVLVDIDQNQGKPDESHQTPDGLEHIVIIGSGAGGVSAAEELLKLNFNGKISIISSDDHQPYDRNGFNQRKNQRQLPNRCS